MLGDNIRKYRNAKKLGVNDLGRAVGISPSYISALEKNNKKNPSMELLENIANILGVSIDRLTGEAASSIIENRIEEIGITLEEVAEKSGVPLYWIQNLDTFVPGEWGGKNDIAYKLITQVAEVIGVPGSILRAALARQEAPAYEGTISTAADDFSETPTTNEYQFKTPQEAMEFILKQPAIMGYGGFNINKMTDEEIMDFANELLRQMEIISYKYKKK
jgi:transcriptional regulator with XRE-family HTH domain